MSAYAGHLASLQQKTDIIASEDILSNNGVLIAKSGTKFSTKTCQNLLKFKLLKPVEDSIVIENQLTAKTVYNRITHSIQKDPCLSGLNQNLCEAYPQITKTLQHCCLKLDKYPILLQKLTVLELEINGVFKQSLLSAYFASVSSMLVGKNKEYIENSFLAGLVHDIGLLHIDRYILSKPETLTAQEWRKVQSHPIIGYEILKRIPKIPKVVSIAVLEHHESTDGSGYPRGKSGDNLSDMGQLINLLDNIIVIYNKKLKPFGKGIQSVIPIIQINMHSYFTNIVSQIFQLSKHTPETYQQDPGYSLLAPLATHVQQQQDYINHLINIVINVNDEIDAYLKEPAITSIQSMAINILRIVNSAGLSGDHLNWIDQIKSDTENKQLYSEIDDTRLMQGEIIYQLSTYQKSVNVFANNNPEHPVTPLLQTVCQQFLKAQNPQVPKALTIYWKNLSKIA